MYVCTVCIYICMYVYIQYLSSMVYYLLGFKNKQNKTKQPYNDIKLHECE